MDAIEAIKARRSVRSFSGDKVGKELIEKVADAGRMAATARNEQPWEFVAVTDPAMVSRLAEATDYGKFMARASACIAVFCKDTKYYLEDGSAATQNMLVAAASLGLGSCWVAGDKKPYGPQVAKMLGVPDGYRLVSLVPLGFPSGPAPKPQKRTLGEVLHWEKF